jgi:hypothetical protein
MAINDDLLRDGRGRAIRIDGSLDKFSTIAYRWGNVAGELDGTNMYSNRVMSVAPVRRGLGQNRVAGGGTCELVLANADGALDALAGQSSMSTQAKLRLRIYAVLWTPGASPISFTSKLLGEFSLTGWVKRNNETLTLPLGDDVMGAVAQQAALPNFVDWQGVGTTANNPIKNAMGLPNALSEYSPIQLAFGEDWVLALPHVIPWNATDAAYVGYSIVPVCCTTDTGAGSDYEVTNLRIQFVRYNGSTDFLEVPSTYSDSGTQTLWRTERSPTITKDGKSFKIIYLVVSNAGLERILSTIYDVVVGPNGGGNSGIDDALASLRLTGGYPVSAVDWAGPEYKRRVSRVLAWYVKGVPLSARTQTTSPIQHPVDVLTDLVNYYSNNTSITVNTTERERVRVATASAACAGVVQPWQSGPKKGDPVFQQPPSLRQTITALCQSSDIDCFIDWSGQFSFAADFWDITISNSGSATWTPDGGSTSSGNGVTTAYYPTVIPETWLSSLEETLPSDGERWAPYNRLWLTGGKANPAEQQDPPFQGPYDFGADDQAAVALADRVIEATLEQGWRPYRQQIQDPRFWRSLNVTSRPVVRFRTHIGGLLLELGQYFALSWTRGPTLAGPYSGTIFQCEAITYAPGDDTVEVTAVWRDDVMTERQYILDDETLLVRSLGPATTATAHGTDAVDIGGVSDLTSETDWVAGDILVLRDTTQAADVFTRNGTWRITAVGDVYVLVALNGEGNYPASGVVAAGQWSVVRGATTYPTAVSDPTNYPLGGDRYGKVTDTSGEYSNAEAGNRLISG